MQDTNDYYKLSPQAMGTFMMTLQKCLIEQSDITDLLRNLDFYTVEGHLFVRNPPSVVLERPTETVETEG